MWRRPELGLRVRPIAYRPENRAFVIEPPILHLELRELAWQPTPKVRASVEILEGDDAIREWAFYSGSAA